MDSTITLITYSHTDYQDIWPLVFDGISKIELPISKVFAINENAISSENTMQILDKYTRIQYYDDIKTYPQKLLQILEAVSTPYILLIHDIDLLVHFESEKFKRLVTACIEHSIDRCILGMIPKGNQVLTDGDIVLTEASREECSPHYHIPYDVGPSIWNVSCLQECMTKFESYTYRTIESSPVQHFLQSKKVYAMTSSESYKAIYAIGRPFSSYFSFLHILLRGKWLERHYYQDLEDTLLTLLDKYEIDVTQRGFIAGWIDMFLRKFEF